MSLEEAINANTAAVLQLVEALKGQQPAKAETPKPAPKAAPAKALTEPKASAAKPATPPKAAEAPEISEDDVKRVTTELLAAKGYKATADLLASVGAAKATQVKPEDRAKYYADAKSLMAAV